MTLNLGLRYELPGVPTEDHNLFGNWEPSIGLEQVGKNISSIYKRDGKNFSPRVGAAWDVTGKGTTIVRLGGSIVYDVIPMSTFLSQQNLQSGPVLFGIGVVPTGATIYDLPGGCRLIILALLPWSPIGNIFTTAVNLPGSGPGGVNWQNQTTPIYPTTLSSLVQCSDGATVPGGGMNPCNTFAMNRNFRTPYVTNWTLGVQHSISGKLALDVTYVGNHAVKLPGVVDLNQAPPTPTADGTLPFATNFSYLGQINYLSNFYGSTYHGLQSTLTARNYHGLEFVAGYTFSHALDDLSSNWVAFLPQDSAHPLLEHASGDEDIRHRFTLSVTYSLPEKKTWTQLLEGWQLNTIITLQSGQPWNVNDQNNNFSGINEGSDRWNFFGNPADFKSIGPNGIPCFGPGSAACTGAIPAACTTAATSLGASTLAALNANGFCYVVRNSVLIPNGRGQFGNMGRNIFRDTGFRNVDLSVAKTFKFGERIRAQFRVETFNLFNHPNFANPWGATSTYGQGAFADPSQAGSFGCGCATPDNAAFNPVLGSGSARAIQLGLKFLF